ncbi:MAG: DNA cytosine methyltransferase, partial [Phycisphaerales bacterium]
MRELALFAGAGGGILGGHLLGWRTVCAVEWDRYAASVLVARQNDGCLPPFPIWDDVCTFDGRPWRGRVDVVSGGFPCQDISIAGTGKGLSGDRSSLWFEMARIIREVGPRYVLVENAAVLNRRGLDRVLGDLAAMGFDAEWGVYSAEQAGAPHLRQRTWIVAYANRGCSDGGDQEVRAGRDAVVAGGAAGWGPHPDADRRRFEEQRIQEHRVEQGAPGDELDGLRAAGRGTWPHPDAGGDGLEREREG